MKSPKGQGGVIEKRITKNVLRICIKMVHYWVEISESLDEIIFFSIRVFFTDTDDSQDSRGREGTIFYFTLPLPPAHEH